VAAEVVLGMVVGVVGVVVVGVWLVGAVVVVIGRSARDSDALVMESYCYCCNY